MFDRGHSPNGSLDRIAPAQSYRREVYEEADLPTLGAIVRLNRAARA